MSKYQSVADEGHGWLRVPIAELRDLGIAGEITPYSYREGDDAWLEEDCDVSTFVRARAAKVDVDPADWWEAFWALDVSHKNVIHTHIRTLPRYVA